MAAPAPGALVSKTPSRAALAEVRAVIDLQAAQVDRLDKESMRALLPALVDARNEIQRDIAEWLANSPDGDERFTQQQYRRSLMAIDESLRRIHELAPELENQLTANARAAAELSREHLIEQVARFGAAFGESVYPTDIELAAVVAKGDKMLIPKYRTSAARYANGMAEDIRHQLSIAAARNETWSQMKARLVRHGGPRGEVALRGILGDPGAVSEYIAEGLFRRHRYWAERIVRTEMVQAYNVQHQAGIELLNEARDPKVTAEYVQRWDATLDKRACPICSDLDRRIAKVDGTFKGGYKAPPAHPQCRCLVVAWHVSWGDIKGEVPAVEDATDPLPAMPRTPEKKQRTVTAKKAAGTAPEPAELPDPRAATLNRAMDLVARGKLTAARAEIDADLVRDGLEPSVTLYQATNKVKTHAKISSNAYLSPRNGDITIRSDRARAAQVFAKEWQSSSDSVRQALRDAVDYPSGTGRDRAAKVAVSADCMRTLMHETFHGHGPAKWTAHNGYGLFTEEVVTELSARAYMRDNFGVPREMFTRGVHPDVQMGSYRGWCANTLRAVEDVSGLDGAEAVDALDRAVLAYKRLPRGTITNPVEAIDQLATLLPGDTETYKVKLRTIARSNAHDDR